MRPLAFDLFTGLHGWAEGLIAAGWEVFGVDLEDMSAQLGETKPEHFHLWLQDVLSIHGVQLKDAGLIVSSSPCQDFSYRAMPWTRARALTGPFRGLQLFWAQFRIQREASIAAGHHIPMVAENVRGAIPWVGRSRYNFGSYHLWGDVPALMPPASKSHVKVPGMGWYPPDDLRWRAGQGFNTIADRNLREEDGRKVPGFRFDGSKRSFQTASVEGMKAPGGAHIRDGAVSTARLTNPAEGRKHHGDWFRDPTTPTRQGGARLVTVAEGRKGAGAGAGAEWFDQNLCVKSSKSPARKAASAKIAKIPLVLSTHIGRTFLPR